MKREIWMNIVKDICCKEKIIVQNKTRNVIYFENLKAYLIFENFE